MYSGVLLGIMRFNGGVGPRGFLPPVATTKVFPYFRDKDFSVREVSPWLFSCGSYSYGSIWIGVVVGRFI